MESDSQKILFSEWAVNGGNCLATPQFCEKPRARRGEQLLRTPRLWFHLRTGGLQWRFLGRPSIRPSFAERGWIDPVQSFPAGIPHPSLSPPSIPNGGKTGGWQVMNSIDCFSIFGILAMRMLFRGWRFVLKVGKKGES